MGFQDKIDMEDSVKWSTTWKTRRTRKKQKGTQDGPFDKKFSLIDD